MAKLGTPENPEIIEPGRPRGFGRSGPTHSAPRPAVTPAPIWTRVRTGLRLVGFLGLVTTPALIFDGAWWWLVRMGWSSENPLAWLLALLITPAAALSTLLAILAVPLLLLAIVFLVLGRKVALGRFEHVAARARIFR